MTKNPATHIMVIGSGKTDFPLNNNANWAEFDTIAIRPSEFSVEFSHLPYIEYLSEWDETCSEIQDRIAKIYSWVHEGNTLIVELDTDYEPTFSSDTKFSFNRAVLPGETKLVYKSGQAVQLASMFSDHPALKKFVPTLRYECIVRLQGLTPIFSVARRSPGPDEYLGGIIKAGKGQIVIVPPTKPEYSAGYYQTLGDIAKSFRSPTDEYPAWAVDYVLPAEKETLDALAILERELGGLNEKKQITQQKLEVDRQLKSLFLASGNSFVTAVKESLIELGVAVVEGPHPRADLIAVHSGRCAALEVKGLDGPVRETNVRQADRWKLEVDSAITFSADEREADSDLRRYGEILKGLGIQLEGTPQEPCKGILVIGTFRKAPLRDRNERDFPVPVAKAMLTSRVCGLTGLQLMGLVLKAREQPLEKQVIVELLFSTNGILHDESWKKYVRLVDQA
jgi:hypothetical protein